jgi:conjugative relaxase-like TrwC/TraI family protein
VLSIGKMVIGAEAYYLSMVAGGREEYYTGTGEAPGTWVGTGTVELALSGEVAPDDLRRVLDGTHPHDGTDLGARRMDPRRRVAGFDLTFSAPKSVSLLYGLGSPETAAAVKSAHDRSMADGLSYLEHHALFARRGHGGAERIATSGLVAAAFVHRTSRAGDPQLHTHVLAANAVLGADGRWSAPEARLLYYHARTAGFVYQASLRARLVEALGISFGPLRSGSAEVAGVDPSLLRGFSTRRAEIEEYLFLRGESSRRSAEVAALATREPKSTPALALNGAPDIRQRWRARSIALGVDPNRGLGERGRPRAVTLGPGDQERIAHDILKPEGITAHDSVFERRDVVRAVAERLPEGAALCDIETLVDRLLTTPAVVELASLGRGGEHLCTTTELLEVEAQLLERAELHAQLPGPRVNHEQSRAILAEHALLSDEQRSMVRRLATSGAGIEVVVGKAGAGKTTALSVAREAFEGAGYRVSGSALSARAAAELAGSAGIESVTLARFLGEAVDGTRDLGPRDVVVVDEAGMVGTRDLAKVVDLAHESGAKLILVGDPRQLPEIEAGGAYANLARRLGAIELSENRRQSEAWERDALDHLRHGEATAALGAYDAHDRIHLAPTMAEIRAEMVRHWSQARSAGTDTLMLAATRRDVNALNGLARGERLERGELGDDVLVSEHRSFALGDEVLCLRNARRLGLLNGTRGVVLARDGGGLSVETDAGPRLVPKKYIEAGHLDHGYASTIHKAQGATYDRAFVLASESLSRESGYVAMSRARHGSELFVASGPFEHGHGPDGAPEEPLATTAARLATTRAKHLASEYAEVLAPRGVDPRAIQLLGWPGRGKEVEPLMRRTSERWATDLSGPPPSPWITEILGSRPAFVDEQPRYDELAAGIEEYRRRHGVDGEDPLGDRPRGVPARLAFDSLTQQIRSYERCRWRQLDERGLEPHGLEHPGLKPRGLDLGWGL